MSKKLAKLRTPNDFNITIEGDINSIDISTLTNTLLNFNELCKEINRVEGNETDISIQVKAFKPGSFDIFCALGADPNFIGTLFGTVNDVAQISGASIVALLADLLAIKEFIGNKKIKGIKETEDNKLIVRNNSGKTKVVSSKVGDLIMNNPVINISINNAFNTLTENPAISGLTIKDNEGKKRYRAKRENFKSLTTSAVEKKKKVENTVAKKKVNLSIFKIVFGTNNSWDFYFEGNKISAVITDVNFHKKLLNGMIEFINGDIMVADIEILQIFNEAAKVFENRKYTITKVHEVQHLPAQGKLSL